jgi:integrase
MVDNLPKNSTKYMASLFNKWIEDGRSRKTASQYLRNLIKLNNNKPFTNLTFLKDYETIQNIISKYVSKRHLYGTILSAIKYGTSGKAYKPVYEKWNQNLLAYLETDGEKVNADNRKEKFNNNYMSWNDIMDIQKKLQDSVMKNKKINADNWNDVLKLVVLSIYTLIPPRRNEYVNMLVTPKIILTDESDMNNYYGYTTGTFVINEYKTKKNYGRFVLNIPHELDKILRWYIKHHPLRLEKNPYPLLVNYSGETLNERNGIQKILYSIFKPKKIGSTMLRHIYLTDKYGKNLAEANKDASAMGHSLNEAQETYIQKD